jgi:hypothetical protein
VHIINCHCDDVAIRLHRERDCRWAEKIRGKYRLIGMINNTM